MTIRSLAPLKANTTVLPVTDVSVDPGNNVRAVPTSGHLQPTIRVQTGGRPRVTCRAPIKAAYDLIGFAALKLTALEVQETKYTDGVVASGTAHTKWTLATGATALAIITGTTVDQDGIAFAEIEIVCLSADGTTHPLTRSDVTALLTVSTPVLHTMGPVTLGASRIDGASSHGFSTGLSFEIPGNDGDLYPQVAAVLTSQPVLQGSYQDTIGLLTQLADDLAGDTDAVALHFRQVDATSGVASSTSLSVTASSNRVVPTTLTYGQGQVAGVGFEAQAISSDGSTHPLTVNTADTAP